MKLIVGLGNPGEKYQGNRHNIGFMAADEIARGYGFGPWKKRFQGVTAEGQIGLEKCILLKPSTYMNESGRAVGEAMRFYKLPISDVIVIHDEIDLKPSVIRVKKGGGNAGHNGLKSISAHIGNDYVRVRLGVDHPGDKALVAHYVLQDFAKADREWLLPLLDGVARGMTKLVEGSEAAFLAEAARGRKSLAPAAKVNEAAQAPEAAKLLKAAEEAPAELVPVSAAVAAPEAAQTLEASARHEAAVAAPAGEVALAKAPSDEAPLASQSEALEGPEPSDFQEAEAALAPSAGENTAIEALSEQPLIPETVPEISEPEPVFDAALAAAAAHEAELIRAEAAEPPLFEPAPEDRAKEPEPLGEPRRIYEKSTDIAPPEEAPRKSQGGFVARWFKARFRGGAK